MTHGRFLPGQSGNPGGRPKAEREIVELCRANSVEAIETLIKIMRTGKPSEALAAANSILDRGFGKPKQVAEHTVAPDADLRKLSRAELLAIAGDAYQGPCGRSSPEAAADDAA